MLHWEGEWIDASMSYVVFIRGAGGGAGGSRVCGGVDVLSEWMRGQGVLLLHCLCQCKCFACHNLNDCGI